MIYSWPIVDRYPRTLGLQFSTRAFAIGYSFEWGHSWFFMLGPFTVVYHRAD